MALIESIRWERDSAQREIRILKQEISNLNDEIERLGKVVDSQNWRYAELKGKCGDLSSVME
jgi:peptidoglycan hydrolase CwlO-like protein